MNIIDNYAKIIEMLMFDGIRNSDNLLYCWHETFDSCWKRIFVREIFKRVGNNPFYFSDYFPKSKIKGGDVNALACIGLIKKTGNVRASSYTWPTNEEDPNYDEEMAGETRTTEVNEWRLAISYETFLAICEAIDLFHLDNFNED